MRRVSRMRMYSYRRSCFRVALTAAAHRLMAMGKKRKHQKQQHHQSNIGFVFPMHDSVCLHRFGVRIRL